MFIFFHIDLHIFSPVFRYTQMWNLFTDCWVAFLWTFGKVGLNEEQHIYT